MHCIATYTDSAASDHCFVSVSDFSTYVPLNEKKGTTATARGTFKIHGIGTVRKWVNFNRKVINLTLTNALHTPELSHNLISIRWLDKAGCYTVFGGGEVVFIDKQNNPFMHGKGIGTMYEVEAHSLDNPTVPVQTPISVNCTIAAKNTVAVYATRSHTKLTDIDTWHRHLGHVNYQVIGRMHRDAIVQGLDITTHVPTPGACEDCIMGKHTWCPFHSNDHHEAVIGERTYSDSQN